MSKLATLRKKLNNKKGFTLMEMLIVVAIIVILLAIAIPSFNSALTKSKVAADEANVRAWYAEQMVTLMTDGDFAEEPDSGDYDGGTLQMGTPAELLTISGTSAETFTVTYDAGGSNKITFPQNS